MVLPELNNSYGQNFLIECMLRRWMCSSDKILPVDILAILVAYQMINPLEYMCAMTIQQ